MDIQALKQKLEKEKERLEIELKTIAHKNPSNSQGWEETKPELDTDPADEEEVADAMSEAETNAAILKQLETQLGDVTGALDKINMNTYGTCEVCGEQIEEDRLMANPAARTCKTHM